MMTREQILSEAMSLAPEERELLAEELWLSIDGTTRDEVEQAWAAEIRRRIDEADEHPEDLRSGDEVVAELRAKLKQ